MFRIIGSIVGIISLLSLIILTNTHSVQKDREYTIVEVMEAYQAGQFRIIPTNSSFHVISPNSEYILAYDDGVYRVSDGKYYAQLDVAEFSSDGNYAAQIGQGIFHLETEQWILNSEATLVFSDNSEYVGVAEDGIYRLSDGHAQKLLETDSSEIDFSPNSAFVATLDGVYHLADGHKLLDTNGLLPRFSPDSAYAWTRADGLFRVDDGEKLLDIYPYYDVSFAPNMLYVVIIGDGVYHLDTGELVFSMDEPDELPYAQVEYSPCGEHFRFPFGKGVYHIHDGQKLFETTDITVSPNCTYIVVGNDGVYQLDNMQKVLDVSRANGTYSIFSDDEAYLFIPGDGTYRTSDWQRILDKGSSASFSPNATYMAIDWDGVYRMSDGQRLFSIGNMAKAFTPDESHLMVGYIEHPGIYNIDTDVHYYGLEPLDISAGIMTIGNTAIIIDETVENQRFLFGLVRSKGLSLRSQPDSNSATLDHVRKWDILIILEEKDQWYKVADLGEEARWIPAEHITKFFIPMIIEIQE